MTKKRILVVEDEPITAMTEQGMLKKLGYEVTGVALSGERAIEMAGKDMPDLVLMDIKLIGEMDGLEASLRIQELHQIPVVYVTAFGDKEASKLLKNAPPAGIGYIVKPFTEDELKGEIERLIG